MTVKTGTWNDPFQQFLVKQAQALDSFGWSGSAMVAVEIFLTSAGIDLSTFADRELSKELSNTRGSFILAVRRAGAVRLIQAIDVLRPAPTTISQFLEAESDLPDEMPVDAVLDGIATLEKWLHAVDDTNCGLLNIG